MNTSKIIRSSIIVQWALIALGFTISFFEENNLPPALKNYLKLENEAGLSNIETIGLCLLSVALLGFIVSSIGVYLFKRWSRSLYLWSNIFGFWTLPFLGVTITTPYSDMFGGASTFVIGMTVGLLYFSDAKEHFEKTSNHAV